MQINSKKSSCMRIEPRFNSDCAVIHTRDGRELQWTTEIRYLGVYLIAGKLFTCSFSAAKRSFYRSFNGITRPPGRAKPSVNGVGRCNARMPNFDPMPHSQPLIDWVQNRCGWLHPGAHQHCQVWSGSDQRWRPQVVVTYTRCVTFFPFFLFLGIAPRPYP